LKEKYMTKDEALDLALEALESCGAGHITDGGSQWHDEKLVDKAITAIKQARSAPVQEPDSECNPYDLCAGCRCKFSAAQSAPVQEPEVRFKCTVIDEQHPNGAPFEQWGNSAKRQWVEVEQIKWDGEKLIAKLKEKNT
jgi:hypothetical protein